MYYKCLDILEVEMHSKAVENETIKKEVRNKKEEITDMNERNNNLRDKLNDETIYNEGIANDMKQ